MGEGISCVVVNDNVAVNEGYVIPPGVSMLREGVFGSVGDASLLEGHIFVSSSTNTISSNFVSSNSVQSSAVQDTISAVLDTLTAQIVQEAKAAGSKDTVKENVGFFDNAVAEVKEGKKRRHKNFLFRNLAEFGGSLHNRSVRNAMKLKSKEALAGGFRVIGHRRTVSLCN